VSWTFRDCEADAASMRARARVDDRAVLTAREIGALAGVHFTRRAVSGCDGQVDVRRLRVFGSRRRHPAVRNHDDAHELLHLDQALKGVRFPHDEQRTDWGAVSLLLPEIQMRPALARWGLDHPHELIAASPLVPPVLVVLRAAWLCRRAVAVYREGLRFPWAPDGVQMPHTETAERALVRQVRSAMALIATLDGLVGVPLGTTGSQGVLVILPEVHAEGW
jgi:hypothetical protein